MNSKTFDVPGAQSSTNLRALALAENAKAVYISNERLDRWERYSRRRPVCASRYAWRLMAGFYRRHVSGSSWLLVDEDLQPVFETCLSIANKTFTEVLNDLLKGSAVSNAGANAVGGAQ